MIPWVLIDSVPLPGHKVDVRLLQRDTEFSIQVGNEELMNSREHGSEDALAELALAKIQGFPRPRVLIGGLGLGFTLATTLKCTYPEAQVVVAELLPAVVVWNKGPLGHLAGNPLNDPRVVVKETDVTKLVKAEQQAYEAILLDIDNGPTPITLNSNRWLYTLDGIRVLFAALRPGGILGVWSAGPEAEFALDLEKAGFVVEEKRVKSRGNKGANHVIFLAQRPLKPMVSQRRKSAAPRSYKPREKRS